MKLVFQCSDWPVVGLFALLRKLTENLKVCALHTSGQNSAKGMHRPLQRAKPHQRPVSSLLEYSGLYYFQLTIKIIIKNQSLHLICL